MAIVVAGLKRPLMIMAEFIYIYRYSVYSVYIRAVEPTGGRGRRPTALRVRKCMS